MARALSTETGVWSSGAARYLVEHRHGHRTLVVAVRCRIGSLEGEELALLDTGAQWSVIGGELGQLVEEDLGEAQGALTMDTRFGTLEGVLRRLNVTLVADEGNDLEVFATVFVSEDWPGPVVLGYRGLFERVRLALDPGVVVDTDWFYFGPIE